jgi:hypothetical protein
MGGARIAGLSSRFRNEIWSSLFDYECTEHKLAGFPSQFLADTKIIWGANCFAGANLAGV